MNGPAPKKTSRLDRIVSILRDQGNASFAYLASVLGTSQMTIRRDIARLVEMEQYRFVQRVPGGVIHLGQKADLEYMFDLKLGINSGLKQSIAAAALDLIADGDGIVLDSGTTSLFLARLLHRRNALRVLATDVKVAEELGHHGNITTTIVCGEVRPGYFTIGGELAVEALGRLHFDKAILSADAVDVDNGVTNTTMFEVGVKRKIAEQSRQVILLADSAKFGKRSMFHVFDLGIVHVIVTDANIDPSMAERIRDKGIRLVCA